ncbi:MAG: VWA domain-containing protein [Acidimicrobiia bacterium]|nr:VWA domain-containing protein [Acidimicrobiia bacterium]
MTVQWGWMVPLVMVLAGAVVAVAGRRAARESPRGALRVANIDRLTALPRFQELARTHRRSVGAMAAAAAVLVLATIMLAARPVRSASVTPEIANRDIMLCLDVSGSMAEYNRSVIVRFAELVEEFDGQRIGMTIFNASAVTVFPLTTDYRFIQDEFERFRQTFARRGFDTLGGTLEGNGSSLVPDGIASCALGFPRVTDGRSRSIVVATDNEIEGATLLTMPQVTTLVADRAIRVYAVFPLFDFEDPDRDEPAEIRALAEGSGGAFYRLENTEGTASIIGQIERTDVARLDVEPQLVEYAEPTVWVTVAAASLLVLLCLAWRARL